MERRQAAALPTGALAFLGDALHKAYVRRALVACHDLKPNKLAEMEKKYVCARAQSKMFEAIAPTLDPEELELLHRFFNYRSNNKPKNTHWHDYKQATAFEAFIGYLSLGGEDDKLKRILNDTFKEEYTI